MPGISITKATQELENKALLKNGKTNIKTWNLLSCAKYISALSSIVQDHRELTIYIKLLHKEYNFPSQNKITDFLGDSTAEWVSNAHEWLK